MCLPRADSENHFSLKPSMAPMALALCFLTHPDASSQYSVSQYEQLRKLHNCLGTDSWIRSALMQNTGVSARSLKP